MLFEVFGAELTTATGECASCGARGPVAETEVYLRAPGTVVRCRTCRNVLMVFVTVRETTCVDLLSLACALAPTIETLIAARALQGAAGALLTPSSLAIIVTAFSPKERGAAIGSWTAWGGIAGIIGPLAGGWIVDQVSWRWIFALNVPLVIGTLALIFAAVPSTARVAGRSVDIVGAFLCVVGLAGFVFGLIEQPRYGWRSPAIFVPLLVGVVAFTAFLVFERRSAHPMLKLELFARRNF